MASKALPEAGLRSQRNRRRRFFIEPAEIPGSRV